jgi:hypothetical protein
LLGTARPDQHVKLTGRAGRLKGTKSLLIAAAAPRSLSAIRQAAFVEFT